MGLDKGLLGNLKLTLKHMTLNYRPWIRFPSGATECIAADLRNALWEVYIQNHSVQVDNSDFDIAALIMMM